MIRRPKRRSPRFAWLAVIGTALASKEATSIFILVAKILGAIFLAKVAGECSDPTEGKTE
jgi:hypothetical protein